MTLRESLFLGSSHERTLSPETLTVREHEGRIYSPKLVPPVDHGAVFAVHPHRPHESAYINAIVARLQLALLVSMSGTTRRVNYSPCTTASQYSPSLPTATSPIAISPTEANPSATSSRRGAISC